MVDEKKDMSLKGKNLGVRTISGAVLGLVVVGAILWGIWPTTILSVLVCVGAITELMELASKRLPKVGANYLLIVALAGGWITGVALNPSPLMLLVALLFVPLIFIFEVFNIFFVSSDGTAYSSALVRTKVAFDLAFFRFSNALP